MGAPSRKMLAVFLGVIAVYAACELLSLAGMRLADAVRGYRLEAGTAVLSPERLAEVEALLSPEAAEKTMTVFDRTLGWGLRPDFGSGGQKTNSAGIVALREYAEHPPPGVVRIAAFGESFTQCVVRNEATWERVLEESGPGIEVLNFGVSAYGPDQAYLRYLRDGRRYRPEIVLIGFMTENIWRLVNVFRPYADPANSPLAKPRFLIGGEGLRLVENPLRDADDLKGLRTLNSDQAMRDRLGEHDRFYRRSYYSAPPAIVRFSPLARLAWDAFRVLSWKAADARGLGVIGPDGCYNSSSEAYRILEALLGQWAADLSRDGAIPVVLIFPQRSDIEKWRAGKPKQYQPLLGLLRGKGIKSIDLMDAFRSCALEGVFTRDGHYNEAGNRLVASRVGGALQGWGLLPGPCARMERP